MKRIYGTSQVRFISNFTQVAATGPHMFTSQHLWVLTAVLARTCQELGGIDHQFKLR